MKCKYVECLKTNFFCQLGVRKPSSQVNNFSLLIIDILLKSCILQKVMKKHKATISIYLSKRKARLSLLNISEIVHKTVLEYDEKCTFSGSVLVQRAEEVYLKEGYGYANRSECLPVTSTTRFGMASGCKIFTSVAICQLVENKKLEFDTKLKDVLKVPLPNFDEEITIHQLLTHTSGVPDYFDEDIMEDFEDLWKDVPMYSMTTPNDFLPLFQQENMKFSPGSKFSYNNSGFILLGLVVEEITGQVFSDYVQEYIFDVCEMTASGYYRMDQLPKDTALGYIDDVDMKTWKTNFYSVPVIGGPDGGAFTTVIDLTKFWNGLMNMKLLTREYRDELLFPHVESGENMAYGYGVWISKEQGEVLKYLIFGFDPGVRMHSSVNVKTNIQTHILANAEQSVYPIVLSIDEFYADERV